MKIPWKQLGKTLISTILPVAASTINPLFGVILSGITGGILDSAAKNNLNNAQKKDNAMSFLANLTGDIEKAIKDAGLVLHDGDRFNSGIDTVMEGMIDVMKATAALPKNPTVTPEPEDFNPAQVKVVETDGTLTIVIKKP